MAKQRPRYVNLEAKLLAKHAQYSTDKKYLVSLGEIYNGKRDP